MSNQSALSTRDIQALRSHIERARELAETGDDQAQLVESLDRCGEILSAAADSQPVDENRHEGWIEHTFEDESSEPYGRELDVRIHFDWDDYNSGDSPSTAWGAQVREIEVLAVRYFDQQGDPVSIEDHHLDAAWELLEQNRELIEQRCTVAGCRSGIGAANPLYSTTGGGLPAAASSTLRMAPSQRDRRSTTDRRKHG